MDELTNYILFIFRYCDSLNCLSLAYCTQFTSKGLQSIMASKGCRKLVHLDISGCMQVNNYKMAIYLSMIIYSVLPTLVGTGRE